MDFFKEFITSRRKIKRMERTIARLRRENTVLKRQNARQSVPTVADRTRQSTPVSPETVLSEYLFGKSQAERI